MKIDRNAQKPNFITQNTSEPNFITQVRSGPKSSTSNPLRGNFNTVNLHRLNSKDLCNISLLILALPLINHT